MRDGGETSRPGIVGERVVSPPLAFAADVEGLLDRLLREGSFVREGFDVGFSVGCGFRGDSFSFAVVGSTV